MIELRLLGAVDLAGVEEAAARALLVQSKCVAALAWLTLAAPRAFHRRDRLAALLWPELDQEHARAQVRRTLHTLRRALGDTVFVTRGDEEVGLAPGSIWCDAVEMDDAVEAGSFARALELYRRGDLLPGFFVGHAGEFEDWLEQERTALRDKAALAAWGLAAQSETGGAATIAVRYARQAATLAPQDERMLRRVLALLDRAGDRAGAVRVYDGFARRLKRDFGAEPSRETRAMIEAMRG